MSNDINDEIDEHNLEKYSTQHYYSKYKHRQMLPKLLEYVTIKCTNIHTLST